MQVNRLSVLLALPCTNAIAEFAREALEILVQGIPDDLRCDVGEPAA
jgi:hypothetical protein